MSIKLCTFVQINKNYGVEYRHAENQDGQEC